MDISAKGRISISDEVYNQMLVRISEGIWEPGDKIPSESQLCKMFNVSRVSVRTAILRLQSHGLLDTKQGLGSFVKIPEKERETPDVLVQNSDITGEVFLEFFQFRQAIEFRAIDLFVKNAKQEDLDKLQSTIQRLKDTQADYMLFTEADYEFHMTVIKGSRNQFLYNAMLHHKDFFYHYLEEINRLLDRSNGKVPGGHEEYYAALVNKNPEEAKKILLADNSYYHVTVFKNHGKVKKEQTQTTAKQTKKKSLVSADSGKSTQESTSHEK